MGGLPCVGVIKPGLTRSKLDHFGKNQRAAGLFCRPWKFENILNRKLSFKYNLPSWFKLEKFSVVLLIPPKQSIKKYKDWRSPPFDSWFFFHNKNSFTEMLCIYESSIFYLGPSLPLPESEKKLDFSPSWVPAWTHVGTPNPQKNKKKRCQRVSKKRPVFKITLVRFWCDQLGAQDGPRRRPRAPKSRPRRPPRRSWEPSKAHKAPNTLTRFGHPKMTPSIPKMDTFSRIWGACLPILDSHWR